MHILEGLMKGLIQWLYGLFWQAGEYALNALVNVFSMDMAYFESAIPVSGIIFSVMVNVGRALLLGNFVFQAAKIMMSGLGFDAEEPHILALRSSVFLFLLLAGRQICGIGLGISAQVIELLQVPDSVPLPGIREDTFSTDASWLLVVLIGVILVIQLVKFMFEIGERYVIVGVLTLLSPLAFAMGGSKNTSDIFKGWVRMYASMCLMMALNVVFLKLLFSAMAAFPEGLNVIPWMILLVALMRAARKVEWLLLRVGLNPAVTGDELSRGLPGAVAVMAGKNLLSAVARSKAGAARTAVSAPAAAKAAASAFGVRGGGARPAPSPIRSSFHNPSHSQFQSQSQTVQNNTSPPGTARNPPLSRGAGSPANPQSAARHSPATATHTNHAVHNSHVKTDKPLVTQDFHTKPKRDSSIPAQTNFQKQMDPARPKLPKDRGDKPGK